MGTNKKKVLLVGSNGYIGSRVFDALELAGYSFFAIDSLLRNDSEDGTIFLSEKGSYQNLQREFVDQFSDCIWLAGHSSVHAAMADEYGALRNNLYDLITFTNIFRGRLIYASSGSVYSRPEAVNCTEEALNTIPKNIYDYTKLAFDNYIGATKKNAIGLRFGTVNGFSSRMRNELMINSMVRSQKLNSQIEVSNSATWRPILFIDDLVEGLLRILDSDINSGIYNMSSFNMKIGDIARRVSKVLNGKVIEGTPSNTYNFMMENKMFEQEFNFKFLGSVESIVESLEKGLTPDYNS